MCKRGICGGIAVACALGLASVFAPEAAAQTKTGSKVGGSDKSIGSKKGVSESLGSKEFDQQKLPGTLEIGLALGSIAAVVAAIKWL